MYWPTSSIDLSDKTGSTHNKRNNLLYYITEDSWSALMSNSYWRRDSIQDVFWVPKFISHKYLFSLHTQLLTYLDKLFADLSTYLCTGAWEVCHNIVLAAIFMVMTSLNNHVWMQGVCYLSFVKDICILSFFYLTCPPL